MHTNCKNKQKKVKALFALCATKEAIYEKIMEIGRGQQVLSFEEKIETNLVQGCQSRMHLVSFFDGMVMHFKTESDALISSGLGRLMTMVYDEESPETIIQCPPSFLEELGIPALISPSRANGLYSLHLKMKQLAIQVLIS